MDQFGSNEESGPKGGAATAVADPDWRQEGQEFIYNPWKMKDVRRLYVNLQDGTKIGYLDLASMEVVPERVSTGEQLRRALAQLLPHLAAVDRLRPPRWVRQQGRQHRPFFRGLTWQPIAPGS